jgi:hypothetical protein
VLVAVGFLVDQPALHHLFSRRDEVVALLARAELLGCEGGVEFPACDSRFAVDRKQDEDFTRVQFLGQIELLVVSAFRMVGQVLYDTSFTLPEWRNGRRARLKIVYRKV